MQHHGLPPLVST